MLKNVKTELFECQRYLESSVLDAFYTRIIDQILRIKDVEQSETHLCLDAEFEISGVEIEACADFCCEVGALHLDVIGYCLGFTLLVVDVNL